MASKRYFPLHTQEFKQQKQIEVGDFKWYYLLLFYAFPRMQKVNVILLEVQNRLYCSVYHSTYHSSVLVFGGWGGERCGGKIKHKVCL